MTDRLIIADASNVTPSEFLNTVGPAFGFRPRTAAEKAAIEERGRRRMAEIAEQNRREMIEMRKRLLALFTTEEARAEHLVKWTAEGVDCTALTETIGDPLLKGRAA